MKVEICFILLLLSTVESNKDKKEYSRIRQLSADQYRSQYGVVQQSGVQPDAASAPSRTIGRPLFSWNDLVPTTTTTSATTTSASPSTTRRTAIKSRDERMRQRIIRNKTNHHQHKLAAPAAVKRQRQTKPLKTFKLLKKSLGGDEEEEEEGEEEEDDGGESDDGDEEGSLPSEDNEGAGEEEEEEGAEEEADEDDSSASVTTTTMATMTTQQTISQETKEDTLDEGEDEDEGSGSTEAPPVDEDPTTSKPPPLAEEKEETDSFRQEVEVISSGDIPAEDDELKAEAAAEIIISTPSPILELGKEDEDETDAIDIPKVESSHPTKEDDDDEEENNEIQIHPTVILEQTGTRPEPNEDEDADILPDNHLDLGNSIPSSSSHHRSLHGLDPSVLDATCSPSTPLPVFISSSGGGATVSKYGTTRWPWPPFHLMSEAIFECQEEGYELDPLQPDRLYCSNTSWVGQHPQCIQTVRTPPAPGGEGVNTELGSMPNNNFTGGCSGEDRGGCDHLCFQALVDPVTGTSVTRCSCYRGFRLDPADGKSCLDVDECAAENGGCDGTCSNKPGGFLCSCPIGFRLASNGKKCIDNNECISRNGHGPCQGQCVNTHGSYRCSCDGMPGTTLAPDGHSCEDLDECRVNNGGCSHTCLNTLGSAFCACPEGYMLGDDWKTCEDLDECDYDPDDDQERLCPGVCRNTIGSYICVDDDELIPVECPAGYQQANNNDDDATCQDLDECARDGNGGCSHICHNTEGSYRCDCPAGFYLEKDQKTCQDVNECATDNGGCSDDCVNMPGSYRCSCPDGYVLTEDWKTCQDVDECQQEAQSSSSLCGNGGTCQNTPGSFQCICPTGYKELDGNCHDIDECFLLDPCGPGECLNTPGSYGCICNEGFQYDNQTCQDVDECNDAHLCPMDGLCQNTIGSFICSCPSGYYLSTENNTCADVDECVNSPCIDGGCINQPGSYLCVCEPGFILERNVCIDFDECLDSPCINGTCVNQIGTYHCACPDGHELHHDNHTCLDVNECESNPCVNGHCVNTVGGHYCECQTGYKALGNVCLDIDECETVDPCLNGECINTPGSYQCECLPGYYLHDNACLDVDECQNGRCNNATCTNLPGSYECSCPAGYTLTVEPYSCLDHNECDINNGGCDQLCVNTAGSFYCTCQPGFYQDSLNKGRCLDIDECLAGNGGCSQICHNSPGSHRCECRAGYILANDKFTCLEVASSVTNYCPPLDPPPGGYLHCSNRPSNDGDGEQHGYKPGTTCSLRCRKGYTFRRHKAPLTWQNQVTDETNDQSSRLSSSGLAMLQGWKATQVWSPDWPSVRNGSATDERNKYKVEKIGAGRVKNENEKRQLSQEQMRLRRQQQQQQQQLATARDKRQPDILNQPVRRCGDDGRWKGKLGFCQALTCPPLTKPANGSVSPASCATGDAAPHQHCYFTCNPGFRVTGNPVRTCLPSLKWNPLRPPPTCEKVYPWPRIECPKDMTIDLHPGKKTIEVLIPQPATNVEWMSQVEAEPSWAKKLRADLGPSRMVVSFRARNPVTEYTAICSFVLEVRDREAPHVKDCPHDVHARLSSLEPYVSAAWTEPIFSDNIAVTHVIKTKEPGSLFPVGDHTVTYTASDAAGNSARCEFTVSVSPAIVPAELNRTESCAPLDPPLNGDLNCLSWTWGQLCRPTCSPGHIFFRPLPSAVYLCGRDRRWKPGTSVPDCAPTSVLPEGGCSEGKEERRSGGKQCVGCAPGLHRPSNSTVCIPCPMGTYQDNFSAGSCKSCPKRLTTCSMGARHCTECKSPEECDRTPGSGSTHPDEDDESASAAQRRPLRRLRKRPVRRPAASTTTAHRRS